MEPKLNILPDGQLNIIALSPLLLGPKWFLIGKAILVIALFKLDRIPKHCMSLHVHV